MVGTRPAINLPEDLRQKIVRCTTVYNRKNKCKLKANVSTIMKIIQSETKKGKRADKATIRNAEDIINVLSAIALHKPGDNQKDGTTRGMRDIGRGIARYFSRHGTGEETIVRDTPNRTKTIIEMELERIRAVDSATRERLADILEDKKKGERLAKTMVDHVARLDKRLQGAFCKSVAPELLEKIKTTDQLDRWLSAIITKVENFGDLQNENVEITIPLALKETPASTKLFGREKHEIAQFLQTVGLLEEKLKQLSLILGPENRAALGEIGGEIAAKSGSIRDNYLFVEQIDVVIRILRECDAPQEILTRIVMAALKKSVDSSQFARWIDAITNVARYVQRYDNVELYLKTLFVNDLETTKPEKLLDRVKSHLEQIEMARQILSPAIEALAGKRLLITAKVQDAAAKLKEHLADRLEQKYAEAKTADRYDLLPTWERLSTYDAERDVILPLMAMCRTEKEFLGFIQLLLNQNAVEVAAGIHRRQRGANLSHEYLVHNLREYLASRIYDRLSRRFENVFPSPDHTVTLRGEYPSKPMVPALAAVHDMLETERVLLLAIDRYGQKAEQMTRIILSAYRKAFSDQRPQNDNEFKDGIMAALPKDLNEQERMKIAQIIKWLYNENWAEKPTVRKMADTWSLEPGTTIETKTGVTDEEIEKRIQKAIIFHYGAACQHLFNALPGALNTRPQNEITKAVALLETLDVAWSLHGGYASYFIEKVFETMKGRSVEEIEMRLWEIERASQKYSPKIADAVGANIGLLRHPRFSEFLVAVGETLQATDYEDVGMRNDICGVNSSNYIGLFVSAHGMDLQLMKASLTKLALAARRLDGMAKHYYLTTDGGAQKLIGSAKAENFDELLERVLRAYTIGEAADAGHTINRMITGMIDRQVLTTNPNAFSEIFVELEQRIAGLDKTRAQAFCYRTEIYVENANFASPFVMENFREYVDLIERMNRVRDLRLATQLSSAFPIFTRRIIGSGASLRELKRRYCDVKTVCEEREASEAIGKITDALRTQHGSRQKTIAEPFQTASGFYWSREKLDFLAQTMRAQPSWTARQHATKINERYAEVQLPAFLLVAVSAASTRTEHLETVRTIIGKKQIKGSDQYQYRIASAVASIATLEEPEGILDPILRMLAPAKGKEVRRGIVVLSGVAKLIKLGNVAAAHEFAKAISDGRVSGIDDAETEVKTLVGRTLVSKMQMPPEKLATFGFAHSDVAEFFEREEKITDIVSSYVTSVKQDDRDKILEAVGETLLHLMAGDYSQWRYTNPKAIAQLAVLRESNRQMWIAMCDPATFKTEMNEDEFISYRAMAVMHALEDAATHTDGRIGLTKENLDYLNGEIARRKASGEKTDELENERSIVFLYLELTATNFTRVIEQAEIDQIMEKHLQLVQALKAMGFVESADDLERMRRSLLAKYGESQVRATISETDDFETLMQIGEIPVHSCQSYLNGGHNHCLLAYVLDANKRAIIVKTEDGIIVGRAITKLVRGKIGDTETPVLVVEPLYASVNNPAITQAVLEFAKKKAASIGATVAVGTRMAGEVPISIQITTAPSVAPYEYSDTYGSRLAGDGYSITAKMVIIDRERKILPRRSRRQANEMRTAA